MRQGAELHRERPVGIRLIRNEMVNTHIGGCLGEDALFKLCTTMEKPQGWQQSQKENRVKAQ